ncbi:hypothetical protein GPJ56_001640 [Histomonas meleagridis]|uniref:uncharacterized protein n=1 Tax=Histomonas meleagridis TaxID=135588 RepID=UPI00355994B4|nr:hypothetical protein GPJ56_001640 [Histomonas meleagridis]KAH0796274.1 hypothetical protein GO595_010167 [Histomonas meleagridis]
MSWDTLGPSFQSIKDLVKAPDTKLETVLLDPALFQSLRYEIDEIVKFLLIPNNLTRLIKWSLSDELSNEAGYFKYSKIATGVLTSLCYEFQTNILESKQFTETISNFLSTTAASSPYICGNFQRIIEHFLKFTHGDFLEAFPQLIPQAISKINILAIWLLLFDILTEFQDNIKIHETIISHLSEAIRDGGNLAGPAISLIKNILSDKRNPFNPVKSTIVSLFDSLLHFCELEVSSPLCKTESFLTLSMLQTRFGCNEFQDLLDEYEPRLNFSSSCVDGIFIFRLYPNKVSQILTKFYSNATNTFIAQIALDCLRNLSQDEIATTVETYNLIDHIIPLYESYGKFSGHISQIILLLIKQQENIKSLQTDKWKQFITDTFSEKKQLLESPVSYGGELPNSNSRIKPVNSFDIYPQQFGIKSVISNFDEDEFDIKDETSNNNDTYRSGQMRKDVIANFAFFSSDSEEEEEEENEEEKDKEEEEEETTDDMYRRMMAQVYGLADYNPKQSDDEEEEEEEEISEDLEEDDTDDQEEEENEEESN